MTKEFFYINGDSWLAHFTNRVANSEHPLFENKVVINHSIPGSSNLSIIRRTKQTLEDLSKVGIRPRVCVGLAPVGRDFDNEFALARPQTNLTEYLKAILVKEFEMLTDVLTDYESYMCTSWSTNPVGTLSLIDFIDEDWSGFDPVYVTSNGIYQWLTDRRSILGFSQESFIEAVESKQRFESTLLSNPYIDSTLHLDKSKSDQVYEQFFNHVLAQ